MKKPLAYLMIFAVLFTATAEAKKKRKGKGGKPKVNKEQVQRDAEKKAVDGMLDKRDFDKNGLLKLDEWLVEEDNEDAGTRKFQSADKNKDRNLSRSEIGSILGF